MPVSGGCSHHTSAKGGSAISAGCCLKFPAGSYRSEGANFVVRCAFLPQGLAVDAGHAASSSASTCISSLRWRNFRRCICAQIGFVPDVQRLMKMNQQNRFGNKETTVQVSKVALTIPDLRGVPARPPVLFASNRAKTSPSDPTLCMQNAIQTPRY